MSVNILIVEDNATKQIEIEKTLSGANYRTRAVRSIAQAYLALGAGSWELVILDMTFQVGTTTGFQKEPLAGVELLQFMTKRKLSIPVIVATQHSSFSGSNIEGVDTIEDLHLLLSDSFPRNYRQTVEVDLSEEGWKSTLRAAVEAILEEMP